MSQNPPQNVVRWLDLHFPKPRVDQDWLNECCAWIIQERGLSPDANFEDFIKVVKDQLIKSNLSDSMQPGTGLAPQLHQFRGKLATPPVLVEITSIMEIGTSAFQLEQVRAAREERMTAGVGNEEGEDEGDIEVEGEGPMPKYPRRMLRFQLSDGNSTFSAMEYRKIPSIVLGVTPLGFKLQLKGTRMQNGMAFLEPDTVELLGGEGDNEENQQEEFRQELRRRRGLPPDQPMTAARNQPPRSPLGDIPGLSIAQVVEHQDDIDMEPKRRVPSSSATLQPTTNITNAQRPIMNLPSRAANATSPHFNQPPAPSGSSVNQNRASSFPSEIPGLDFNLQPTPRQAAQLSAVNLNHADDSFDFDFFDELDNNGAQPPSHGFTTIKGKGVAQHPPSDDFDFGDMDDQFDDPAFLQELAKVEEATVIKLSSSQPLHLRPAVHPPKRVEIIDLTDSESDDNMGADDKENAPVATRHVRRRVSSDDDIVVGSPVRSQRPPASQGNPRRLPSNHPVEVIDLSD